MAKEIIQKTIPKPEKKPDFTKQTIAKYQKRIALALEQLIKSGANPDNIVVIGYCFGGTGALEAARGHLNVKGVVSFHGGLGKDASRPTEPITAKVLVCHGADDPYESERRNHRFPTRNERFKSRLANDLLCQCCSLFYQSRSRK